jgi:glycosyltransferase involved in cell wall biosynthesis
LDSRLNKGQGRTTIEARSKKKVLAISFYFPPANSIASIRLGKFVKYLPQFGWEPVVLTVDAVRGYSQDLPVETKEASIFRTPYFALGPAVSYGLTGGRRTVHEGAPGSSAWRRALYGLLRLMAPVYTLPLVRTLTLEPVGWYRHALRKGLEIMRKERIDVIFSSYGPSVSHFVAARLHRQTGIPWVAEFRDLWSLNYNLRKVQPFYSFEKKLEKKVMKGSDLLVTVSRPAAEQLEMLHPKKVAIIPNGFDEEDYAEDVALTPKFTITYTGNIYPGKQDATSLLEAIARLKEEGELSADNVEARFFGGGTLAGLLPAIKSRRLEKIVKICGLVPLKESIRKQKESTVLLFLGWTDPGGKGFYSGKIFEYLGARRPILAVGRKGDVVDELLRETGAGVVTDDVNEIKALLREWMEEFKQSGNIVSHFDPDSAAVHRYTRKQETAELARLLDEVSTRAASKSPLLG